MTGKLNKALLIAAASVSMHSAGLSQGTAFDPRVDSLITTEKLNPKTLLVCFGSDAVTAIAAQKGIVVIDAGLSASLTAKYKKRIETEFNRNDFRYLVNTHGHIDHNGGNSAFAGITVIGQENGLKEIENQWKDPEKLGSRFRKIISDYEKELKQPAPGSADWNFNFGQKTRYACALDDLQDHREVLRPDSVFSDSLSLDLGDLTFEMIFFGKAHSGSDILIFCPGLKMLMVGDLFSKYGRPDFETAENQDAAQWKKAVKWLEARKTGIELILTGHGSKLSMKDLDWFLGIIKKHLS